MAGDRSRVLVVEDNPAVSVLLSRWLIRRGCEAVCVADEPQALGAAGSLSLSAALVDVDLGRGVSGLNLARRLLQACPGLRIVLMSGDPANGAAVRQAGFGRMLVKPFPIAELEQVLQL